MDKNFYFKNCIDRVNNEKKLKAKMSNRTNEDLKSDEKRSALKEMVKELMIFKSCDYRRDYDNETEFVKRNKKYRVLAYKV